MCIRVYDNLTKNYIKSQDIDHLILYVCMKINQSWKYIVTIVALQNFKNTYSVK